MRKNILFLITFNLLGLTAFAQSTDSLLNLLNQSTSTDNYTSATFKTTRVVLNHSVETVGGHLLDVRITHRFGDFAGEYGGSHTFWGLDNSADIRLALEYGINDRLTVSLGRNKYDQLIDTHLKYRLLRQTTDHKMPVSVTLLGAAGIIPVNNPTVFDSFGSRFSFFTEAIIARKFSERLSLQLIPSYLHRNYLFNDADEHDIFSLGASGRFKITKRIALVADYSHPFSSFRKNSIDPEYYDPFAIGIEVETGGHVFSINFTNAGGIVENNFIPNTTSSWKSGAFKLGFNISRVFNLKKSRTQ